MPRIHALAIVGFVFVSVIATRDAVADDAPVDPQRVEELLADLNSDDFQTRDAASRALADIGAPVLPVLQGALNAQPDTELKFRIDKIVERIRTDEIAENAFHLDALMEEVRLANEGKLNEKRIGVLLHRLMAVLRKTTGRDDFVLPVRFDDVAPGEAQATSCRQKLVIAPRAKFTGVRDSIILTDVDAHFTSAKNCIIISRAAVKITGAYDCVVLSGHAIRTTGSHNSIMLAGSRLRTTGAHDSIIGATDSVLFTGAHNSDVVNSDVSGVPAIRLPRVLETRALVLREESTMNPFDGRTTVTDVNADGSVTFQLDGVEGEFTAKVDEIIVDADGKPAAALRGWKLVYVSGEFLAFQSATQMAYVPAKK